ncbi:MAG: CotH kinase family protein [Planctomycetia bacterium]|nr:CotH kinase family protein [Planctomycetia bacterium]
MPVRRPRAVRIVSAVVAINITLIASQVAVAQNAIAKPARAAEASLDDFYRSDEVQTVDLRVAEDDLHRMLSALPERIYVRASFRWRDISLDNVAIRFKGNSSSAPSQQHKRSFLIKFDEYAAGQQFLGLRRVSFDNGVQFGSVFSEPIMTEILRDLEIKTHRCNYARLSVNGKYQGVYVNVERIDNTFVERHFSDPDGLLFKVDEGGPGANLQFLGDDPSVYERTFEPETKSAKKGRGKLVEFIRMINQSTADEFAANLESKLEVDDFLRMTTVLLLSGAFDQLTGWQPHNYYLYYDGKHDRWHYLPWDLDVGFCEIAFGQIRVLADWNAAWPAAGQLPNPLLDRIVADPALLQRYRKIARIVLDKYFEPERLCAIIDAKYALIKQDLQDDPFPHRRVTNPEDRNYDDIVASMKKFVRNRYASARQQLEKPGTRPEPVRRPEGPHAQLARRLQRIQRAAEEMQRKGQDVRPIQKLMQQIGPLLQKGRAQEAEKLSIEALKLVGEDPGRDGEKSPPDERKKTPSRESGSRSNN